MKIPTTDHQTIITDYQNLTPMKTIAKRYGTSRQAVYKILKTHGVDTSKRLIPTTCLVCGTTIHRPKCRIRKATNSFCSNDCFIAYQTAYHEEHNQNHHNQVARDNILQFFNLKPHHVIHHIDGKNFFNHPTNLMVFNSSTNHALFHLSLKSKAIQPPIPLWHWDM